MMMVVVVLYVAVTCSEADGRTDGKKEGKKRKLVEKKKRSDAVFPPMFPQLCMMRARARVHEEKAPSDNKTARIVSPTVNA